MKTVHLYNGLGLVIALATSLIAASVVVPSEMRQETLQLVDAASVTPVVVNGRRGLRDAGGRFVPIGSYHHIVSLSSVTDSLLHELADPTSIAAYSPYAQNAYLAYRYEGRPALNLAYSVESLLSLSPDLIVANHLSRPDHVAQLRAAGLQVFDLGEMKGLQTLIPSIHSLATLLGVPERGATLARNTKQRMAHVHCGDVNKQSPRAMYAGIHGDKTYGGGRGTSYHDVLDAAGLRDIAAERYEGWPRYTPEQLLQLDPDILVTQEGMGDTLCRQPGLSALRICNRKGRIIEMETALLLSPGLEMVDAAEQLHALVHSLPAGP